MCIIHKVFKICLAQPGVGSVEEDSKNPDFFSRTALTGLLEVYNSRMHCLCQRIVAVGFLISLLGISALHLNAEEPHQRASSISTARVTSIRSDRLNELLNSRYDPAKDGWNSEEISQTANRILNDLVHSMIVGVTELPEEFAPCRCYDLRPIGDGKSVNLNGVGAYKQATAAIEIGSVAHGLEQLCKAFKDRRASQAKTKLFDIRISGSHLETKSRFRAFGESNDGLVQQNAIWACRWRILGPNSLRLEEIRPLEFVESHSDSPQPWFRDVTPQIMSNEKSYVRQMNRGMNYWLERIEERHGIHDSGRNGISVGDVNGDGWPDLYVCQPGGLPNRLYVQREHGQLVEISEWAGVHWLDETSAALFIDLDNDGDQDLVLGLPGNILVMKNDGNGKFAHGFQHELADEDVKSLCGADFDQDGRVDLYICVDQASDDARPDESRPSFVYFDANEGGANVLLRNEQTTEGKLQFRDVTKDVGLDQNNRRHSLAACWEDFDNDGDQDLYVANDYGQNCLYRNEGGTFLDIAKPSGVVDWGSGMSVDWGDFDNDRRSDLYVGNMWSSAGGRITTQSDFRPDLAAPERERIRRFAKGNTLFANRAEGFQDVGSHAGVEMGRWAWSSLFADINNDSRLDLLVANGYLTTSDNRDL